MRIGIVSSNSAEVSALRRMLRSNPGYEISWAIGDTDEAIEKCSAQPPDVLLLGIGEQPATSIDAVRRIMRESPCPILLLASSIQKQAAPIFEALCAGAVDVVTLMDAAGLEVADAGPALEAKLTMFRKLKPRRARPGAQPRANGSNGTQPVSLLLLGASAGGPSALATVLSGLPQDFAAPAVIVQHIDEQFVAGMAEWLSQQCKLPVRIARDQERMENGIVYIAGRSEHLTLRDRFTLAYQSEPSNHAYKPSIDEMFYSAARFWKDDAVGVLLTGMGQDGTQGLRKLRDGGALTITQDKESSVVFGIPKAAARINAATEILPLSQISARIRKAIPSAGSR
ncbi:MAG: chemotaxis-specific protein-glutamate methyltransferase CheB [Longimicrobiales bacterium]